MQTNHYHNLPLSHKSPHMISMYLDQYANDLQKSPQKAFHVFLPAIFSSWGLSLQFALVMVWELL